MSRFSIRLFGGFEVRVDDAPLSKLGRNERQLLALLSLEPGRTWDRRDIAAQLWPDVGFEISGNRLRTTLVAVRKAAPTLPILADDGRCLRLDPKQFDLDLLTARQLDHEVKLAGDTAEEHGRLEALLEVIRPGLLPDWHEPWLEEPQMEWRLHRQEILQRTAEMASANEDYSTSAKRAEEILREAPADIYAWSTYLVSMAKAGRAKDGLRRLQSIRKGLDGESVVEFDAQIKPLAKAIREGAYAPAPELASLPPGTDQALLQAFRRMMNLDPNLAAQVLSSDSFRLEIFRVPRSAVELLEQLLATKLVSGPALVALKLITMRTYSVLRDVDRVLELGTELLDEPLEPHQQRLVLTVLSFTNFLIRNLDTAFELVERAIAVADAHALPHHRLLTRADRALYVWHLGHDQEALEVFEQVLEGIRDEPEPHITYAPAYLSGIIGQIHLGRGSIKEAERWLESGYSTAKVRQYPEQVHQIEPALAYVRAQQKRVAESGQLILSALAHFQRSRNYRAFVAALDYIGGAFLAFGDLEFGVALLSWGQTHRESLAHSRTAAEERFIRQFDDIVAAIPPSRPILSATQTKQILEFISAELRERRRSGSPLAVA